ncbi:hypothetical protein HHK36_011510 [Tetracentron sinense]|uniref:Outer envelope protein 61 n=1 Tax=Tetracentron sinense TaxID=13715 RepID=A0A834ZB85_TETSI|nr:hypothetical protein HHK36_011510 [Tetracentron sinense]
MGSASRWQRVVYEKDVFFCSRCQKLGHDEDHCKILNKKPYQKGAVSKTLKPVMESENMVLNNSNKGLKESVPTHIWVAKAFGKTSDADLMKENNNNNITSEVLKQSHQILAVEEHQTEEIIMAGTENMELEIYGKVDGSVQPRVSTSFILIEEKDAEIIEDCTNDFMEEEGADQIPETSLLAIDNSKIEQSSLLPEFYLDSNPAGGVVCRQHGCSPRSPVAANSETSPNNSDLEDLQVPPISKLSILLQRAQMMSNPELIRMASESMKNMRPEDLRNAAEQLKYARTEDMVDIGEKMANATPEEIAAMRARANGQITYELSAAQMLKKQGNELHSQGKFKDAALKYLLAKKNLKGIPVSKGRTLQFACSLNLMSCYLKTKHYDECIKEGSEVLAYDAENVKALYRRGQAYKELGLLEDAISDLSKACAVSPDDETVADVLRDANERLAKEGGEQHASRRLVIEEITEEEVQNVQPKSRKSSRSTEYSVTQPQETGECSQSQGASNVEGLTPDAECLQGLKDDPEAIRMFQNFISNADPETFAALSTGNAGGVSPDMIKTASNMIGKMSPEELQKMLHMASSFQEKKPYFTGGSFETNDDSSRSGLLPPGVSPEMLKTATDMMNKMPMEELQKMFEVASSLKGNNSVSATTTLNTNLPKSDTTSRLSEANGISAANGKPVVGESSSSGGLFSNMRNGPPTYPTSSVDLQEQMRNQMKDPAMRQMFTSMIKNMSPDMMANMGEQFGVKLSREEAEKAQQAMSSLSPDALDKMMRWADRIQKGVEGAKKTKNWLLGRPGMILAICMLILAVILHRMGYIGS